MSDCYWYGGTGNWNDGTTHWSNNSGNSPPSTRGVPTSGDNVIFNSASSAGAYTVTSNAGTNDCKDFTLGAPASGKVTLAGSTQINVYGSFNLAGGSAGITWSYSGTIRMKGTTTGLTIDQNGAATGGVVLALVLDGVGGEWTLANNFTSAYPFQIVNGSFITGNYAFQCSNFRFDNTNTKSISLGSSVITLTQGINALNQANTTWDAGTSSITITSLTSVFVQCFGGLAWYDLTIQMTGTNSTGNLNFSNASFHNLYFIDTRSAVLQVPILNNFTVTNTLTLGGSSSFFRMQLMPANTTPAASLPIVITAENVVLSNIDFMGIQGAGNADWNLANQAASTFGDAGGNVGITGFTASEDQHWTNGGGDYKWSTATNWTSRSPLPQDDVYMDYNFGDAKTITGNGLWTNATIGRNIDWSGASWTTSLTWWIYTNVNFTGNLILASGMTIHASAGTLQPIGASNCTLTSNGVAIPRGITIKKINASFLLGDNTVVSNSCACAVTWGSTINTNGYTFSVSSMIINATGVTVISSNTGPILITGTGASALAGTNGSTHTGLIKFTDTSNSTLTFGHNGMTWGDIWFARGASTGTISIQTTALGSVNMLKDTGTAAHTLSFVAFSVLSVTDWLVSGVDVNNKISIISNAAGSKTYFTKLGGGIVSANYLSIKDIGATVPNEQTWFAGTQSTNTSGNQGWNFTAPSHFLSILP